MEKQELNQRIWNLESVLERLITAVENIEELERVGIRDYMSQRELREAIDRAKRELKNND